MTKSYFLVLVATEIKALVIYLGWHGKCIVHDTHAIVSSSKYNGNVIQIGACIECIDTMYIQLTIITSNGMLYSAKKLIKSKSFELNNRRFIMQISSLTPLL